MKLLKQQKHQNGLQRNKKSLSERVHKDISGFEMHRDLFSAFLARNVNDSDELQAASQIQSDWERTEPFCTQAWREHRNRERVGESESRLSHSSD